MNKLGLLTFELKKDSDQLEIHGNEEGLKELINFLKKAIKSNDHEHLLTEDWGGQELASIKQGKDNTLIHHVKIISWKNDK